MPYVAHGIIMLWSGFLATIPSGWRLCDGGGGTPNLRDRFIVGAGGAHSPGDTGGDASHSHTFTSDGHIHSMQGGYTLASGSNWHLFTNSSVDTGTTNVRSNVPPFYALAYIMKV